MNQFGNGNWIDMIKMNLPEHMSDLERDLDVAMTEHGLTEEEAHGAALAAAIASGNNELAFEISMNSPLFGSDLRTLASVAAVDNYRHTVYEIYVFSCDDLAEPLDHKLTKVDLTPEQHRPWSIYSLVCGLIYKSKLLTGNYIDVLKNNVGMTDSQINDIVNIASVVSAINRVAI